MNYLKLSKEISRALRHCPWQYELELDKDGFTDISVLLSRINEENKYGKIITIEGILHIISISDKERLEIVGDKIRALYGHTIPMHIDKSEGVPPDILYHGTTHKALETILEKGLLPMNRQYVHLSIDIETATSVGSRRDANPVILIIDSLNAYNDGIKFYIGNEKIWLADSIPIKYIKIITN